MNKIIGLTKEQKEMEKNGYVFLLDKEGKMYMKETEKSIKGNCEKNILEKYPYHKQINMGADIQEIHLTARLEERTFTDKEMMKVGEGKEMKDWIASQRKECEEKIASL